MCQKEIKTSMGKMKNKVLPVSVLVLFMLMCINACGISKSRDSADMVSELNNRIIEKVAENYEEGNISALDIVIVRIDFGSFSQENTPHVTGLDKTVGILLDADSLEMVAYKEFAADKVVINCIQASDGQSRILVSKTTTYQGISTQEIQLLAVEGSQWVEIPIDALKIIGDESFYYMDIVDDLIIVASEDKLISSEEIVAVLKWNPETEQFVLEQ